MKMPWAYRSVPIAPSQSTGDCFRRSLKFCAICLRIQEVTRSPHFSLCYNPCSCIQVIIPHEVGVPGLKRALILLFSLLPASFMWLSCGNSAPSGGTQTSGIKTRAFITNNVSAGTLAAGVYILNAQTDVRGPTAGISAGNNPQMMMVTPNHALTLVFSGIGTQASDNQFTVINNASETAAGH